MKRIYFRRWYPAAKVEDVEVTTMDQARATSLSREYGHRSNGSRNAWLYVAVDAYLTGTGIDLSTVIQAAVGVDGDPDYPLSIEQVTDGLVVAVAIHRHLGIEFRLPESWWRADRFAEWMILADEAQHYFATIRGLFGENAERNARVDYGVDDLAMMESRSAYLKQLASR